MSRCPSVFRLVVGPLEGVPRRSSMGVGPAVCCSLRPARSAGIRITLPSGFDTFALAGDADGTLPTASQRISPAGAATEASFTIFGTLRELRCCLATMTPLITYKAGPLAVYFCFCAGASSLDRSARARMKARYATRRQGRPSVCNQPSLPFPKTYHKPAGVV